VIAQFIARVFLHALPIQNTDFSVLDLKAHYRGLKYLQETLKRLPQKPEPIVIDQLTEHLTSIGSIHQTPAQLRPG
ncbi:MAG: IS4 family transposase, partial [Proteobacteria bacterium]|nr:IS4 family transposase [Pseudomonadota bacterium]